MTRAAQLQKVTLRSPGAGAYRVQILGDDPTQVITDFLAGHRARRVYELPTGRYTASFENVGTSAREIQIIEVRSGDRGKKAEVVISPLSSSVTATAWRTSAMAKSADCAPSERQFAVGLSRDMKPETHGGWTAEHNLRVATTWDTISGALLIDVTRKADWSKLPKRRLTVSVDGLPALRVQLPLFSHGVQVVMTPTCARPDGGADFDLRVIPKDGRTVALVAALHDLTPSETKQVFRWSVGERKADVVDALIDKSNDPWAAAVAGLVLARDPELELGNEPRWVRRLKDDFYWLPDAVIVAAATTVRRKGAAEDLEKLCVVLLAEAARRGPPFFRAANDLALNLLTSLAVGARSGHVRTSARKIRAEWGVLARRAVNSGAVMSWQVPGRGLRHGRLPPNTYEVVARGVVRTDSVTLAQP